MAKQILDRIFSNHLPSEDELNAYLQGQASPEVRQQVENAMLDEPLLSDAVEGFQEAGFKSLPQLESFSEFQKKLPAVKSEGVFPLNPAKSRIRMAMAVAASLVLVVAGYFFFQEPTPEQLFSEFYIPYENDIPLSRRGESGDLQPDLIRALGHYSAKEYTAALEDFTKALQSEPDNDAIHFFTGLTYLQQGQGPEAIHHLNLVKDGQGAYSHKAQWYAILATLRSGDTQTARQMLEQFLQSPGFMEKEAQHLLSRLSS